MAAKRLVPVGGGTLPGKSLIINPDHLVSVSTYGFNIELHLSNGDVYENTYVSVVQVNSILKQLGVAR